MIWWSLIPAWLRRGVLIAVAAVLLLSVAYERGWSDRGAKEAAQIERLEAARKIEASRIAGMATELDRLRTERDLLAKELEDAAREDPDADLPAFGPDSVRRLNQR